jgi:hypothetical protein
MDDLEDSLKRLFQDSRLDMRVAPDAEKTVVRGARRVRRRRVVMISTAGVMSLAVLAGGTFLLARPTPQSTEVATRPTDLPITTTTTTTTEPTPGSTEARPPQVPQTTEATSTTTQPQAPSALRPTEQAALPTAVGTLGPTGFGAFRLGMTEDQIKATRQAQGAARSTDTCAIYRIQGMPDTSTLTVSKRYGLVAIALTADAATPQHITIGSTEDAVRSTYRGTTSVTAPENPNADYRFRFTTGKVSEITLVAKQQDCLA